MTARGPGTRVNLKRAYEPPAGADGHRVLVDRLWPRGLSRERLALAVWHKELAPSGALRRWFDHDPARWREFTSRYLKELRAGEASMLLDDLVRRAAEGTITLVYAARDEERNNAVVLQGEIARRLRRLARNPTPRRAR